MEKNSRKPHIRASNSLRFSSSDSGAKEFTHRKVRGENNQTRGEDHLTRK